MLSTPLVSSSLILSIFSKSIAYVSVELREIEDFVYNRLYGIPFQAAPQKHPWEHMAVFLPCHWWCIPHHALQQTCQAYAFCTYYWHCCFCRAFYLVWTGFTCSRKID